MIRLLSIISLILIFVSLAIAYVHFSDPVKFLIIRSDAYRQLTLLGSRNDVLKVIIIGFLLIFFNTFLTRVMLKRYYFISKILSVGTFFLSLLILVVIFGIILANQ